MKSVLILDKRKLHVCFLKRATYWWVTAKTRWRNMRDSVGRVECWNGAMWTYHFKTWDPMHETRHCSTSRVQHRYRLTEQKVNLVTCNGVKISCCLFGETLRVSIVRCAQCSQPTFPSFVPRSLIPDGWNIQSPEMHNSRESIAFKWVWRMHLLGRKYKSLIHIEFIHCIPKWCERFRG